MAQTGQASFDILFNLLRAVPETTRTDLVNASGLSKATVSETIAELMAQGFLAEIGKRQPGRGRSQVVLALQAENRLVIGAQFSEHGCYAALCNLGGAPIALAERPIAGLAPSAYVDALAACVSELRDQATAPILGLGVGVPGLVSEDGRTVLRSVPHGWTNVPMCDLLEERIGLRVAIANRAKAAALGEYWQGTFPEHADRSQLIYVFVGSGIIAGYVFDGSLYLGHSGSAGEVGHTTVQPDGQQCGCGNHGCLHTLASESAIIRSVRGQLRQRTDSVLYASLSGQSLETISMEMLVDALAQGDEVVLEAVQTAGTWLGVAIGNLINLLNPSMVVIGGSVSEFGAPIMEAIQQEVRRRALWDALHTVSIVPSTLGDNAGIVGGAALFLDRMTVAEMIATTA
ncbi:MAG: ROK family transcriptional regulator [Thermomicrobiales bacterium]